MKKFIFISDLLRFIFIFSVVLLLTEMGAFAQSVGINYTGTAPNSSAILDIDPSGGTQKGLLIPRVQLTSALDATTIPNPVISLMIYNKLAAGTAPDNVVSGYYYWNGTRWTVVGGGVNSIAATSPLSISGTLTPTVSITNPVPVVNGGTGTSLATGTGSVVLNTSPSITTPTISNPTVTGTMTGSITGNASNVTGTIAVVNGGTNSTLALNNSRVMISSGGKIIEAPAGTSGQVLANIAGVPTWTTTPGGGVNSVSASAPLSSSGGLTPTITITNPIPVVNGGTGTSLATGTGSIVFNTSPSITTPTISNPTVTGTMTGSITGNASNVTGTIAVVNGGTNSTLALNNSRVMISSGGKIIEAPAGTSGQVLANVAGVPTWTTTPGGGVTSVSASAPLSSSGGLTPTITITNPIPVVNGGTGTSLATGTGSIVFNTSPSITTPTISNPTVTGTMTGSITGNASNVTGTIAVVNGGTNSTLALNNSRVMISSGGKIIEAPAGTSGQVLANVSGVPTWTTTPGGGVTSVSASAPLSSSGGLTPTITITNPIPVVNGGTGTSSATGTGSVVLNTSPSITTPTISNPTVTGTIIGTGIISISNHSATGTPSATTYYRGDNTWSTPGGGGTVTSLNGSGGTTGMSFSGGPITTAGTLTLTGTLAAASGGTGLTSYAIGDIPYASAATTVSKLADVATGNSLISGGVGVAPLWGKIGLTTHVTGTLPVANGGTGLASYAIGDIPYASAATTVSKLADVATGNSLISGGVGVAPLWGKIGLTTHVTGTLPVANGGTGATAFTQGSIVFAGASGAYTQNNASLFWDNTNARLGVGTTIPNVKMDINGAIAIRPQASVVFISANQTVPIGSFSYVKISPSNAPNTSIMFSISAGVQAGQILILHDQVTGPNAILTDGGNCNLTGDMSFRFADATLTLIWSGTNWVELSRAGSEGP